MSQNGANIHGVTLSVALDTRPPAALVLSTLIDAQRQAVLAVLADGRKRPRAKRVHALRVAIRRLLAGLELAGALGHEIRPRTTRRLRRLMAVLSPLRDLQVQLRALGPVATLRPSVEGMLALLRAEKRTGARRAGRRLASFPAADFDHDLACVTGSLSALPPHPADEDAVDTVLLGELGKRHLGIERQRRSAPERDPDALHRLRLALKDYRYTLEALAPLSSAVGRELVVTVTRLQDQLGSAHDTHVLLEAARRYQGTLTADAAAELEPWIVELERSSQAAHDGAVQVAQAASLSFPPW